MTEPILQVKHLSKTFGKHEVLRDIDFAVEKGEVISIIGAKYRKNKGRRKRLPLPCRNGFSVL